jgi:hypothetical protein
MKTRHRPLLRTVSTAPMIRSLFLATAGSQRTPGSVALDRLDYCSSKTEPADACLATFCPDRWVRFEASDWRTKRALTSIIFHFTLAGTEDNRNLPVLTIPAQ